MTNGRELRRGVGRNKALGNGTSPRAERFYGKKAASAAAAAAGATLIVGFLKGIFLLSSIHRSLPVFLAFDGFRWSGTPVEYKYAIKQSRPSDASMAGERFHSLQFCFFSICLVR